MTYRQLDTQLEEISLVFRRRGLNRAVCGYPKGRCADLVAMAGFLRKKSFFYFFTFFLAHVIINVLPYRQAPILSFRRRLRSEGVSASLGLSFAGIFRRWNKL